MKLKLKDVRIAFVDSLFEAKEYEAGDGKPRYSATFLVVPGSENEKAIEAAIKGAATETWGAKAEAMLKGMRGNSNKYCYQDGNTKSYDGFQDMMFIASHRRKKDGPVKVRDVDGKTELTADDAKIYGGCYVNAVIEIYAQRDGNPGIRCSLLGVQFLRDGDSFSGSRVSDDDFEDLSVDSTDDDMSDLI